ncbi:hypothetical protein VE02_07299 [Pseudogymnoascus sp. 03VT05]|nr:hypothetical protein VE02_07299 [Pseudogymnoascus sp. 03VT05]
MSTTPNNLNTFFFVPGNPKVPMPRHALGVRAPSSMRPRSYNRTSILLRPQKRVLRWRRDAFDPKSLIAATQTTSQASSSTPSSTSSSTPSSTDTTAAPTTSASDASKAGASNSLSPTPSDVSSTSSSKSLSGGAIGGIVVGAVAVVVLVALAVFFFRRRRQRADSENKEGIPWAALPPQDPAHETPTGKQEPVHELAGGRAVVELPGNEGYR